MTGRNARSPFDPSRFVEEQPKRPTRSSKAVRFQPGEASFTEHMGPPAHSLRHRAAPHAVFRAKVSTSLLCAGLLLLISTVIAYLPGSATGASVALQAKNHLLAVLRGSWESESAVPPSPLCTHAPAALREIVQEAALWARWGPVLRPDFALGADGGRIIPDLTSSKLERTRWRSSTPPVGPEVVLEEELAIGRCWTVGVTGQVGFSTPAIIYPEHVTVDHIPRQIALDIGRAPRRMVLWGVVDGLSNARRLQSLPTLENEFDIPFDLRGRSAPLVTANHVFVALAAFEYDIASASPTQTFAVFDHVRDSGMDFGIFVLEVVDSWGSPETCLYRVRIHGEPSSITSAHGK